MTQPSHPTDAWPDDPKEALIAAVREVASRRGTERLGLVAFLREAGVGASRVYRHFGDWPSLCAAAGLVPHLRNRRVPDDAVFAALHEAFLRHGGPCTKGQFLAGAPFSSIVIQRRFGSWAAALAAFRLWAARNAPDFPHMAALDAQLAPFPALFSGKISGTAGGAARPGPVPRASGAVGPAWPQLGGRVCGEPLGFRALLFAPVNEQGVVLLFGMVASDLGYGVESVTTGFPDCTARRRVSGGSASGPGGGLWESVRVEFEFRSRSFRDHGHDPDGCDVIVCWEHDWPDCPLEVLALRPALAAL